MIYLTVVQTGTDRYDHNITINSREYSFHIGTPDETDRQDTLIHKNITIQADGDELDLICREFEHSIPRSSRRVQYWTGDIARSIWFAIQDKLKWTEPLPF